VGDCKLSSLANRLQLYLEGGIYLSPLAMTGQWPKLLQDWVLDPPVAIEELRLAGQESGEEAAYRGFVMALGTLGQDPTTQRRVGWMEQVFVVCNQTRARHEIQALGQRLARAEFAGRPGSDLSALEQRVAAVLAKEKEKVEAYLEVTVRDDVVQEERLVGPGRPGPNRPRQVVEKHQLELAVTRRTAADRGDRAS